MTSARQRATESPGISERVTMPKLYYFNPDNDLALASGVDNFTPPRAAMLLRRAGELLPLWIGSKGDMVWCTGVNRAWYHGMIEAFGLGARVFDHVYRPDLTLSPWGWSAAMRMDFAKDGCPEELLPTSAHIDRLRTLSHRRTASQLAIALQQAMPDARFTEPAVEAKSPEQVRVLADKFGRVVAKAPWSSSGRGVVSSSRGAEALFRMADNAMRIQGSVMIEPEHDKALDLARIYECSQGRCRSLGTSVFATDERHHYIGNMLADEAQRLAYVGRYTDVNVLLKAAECLRGLIEERIAPYYDGIVGVDMLACADGTLDPVVEINMRCTMGHVANVIADRYLAPGTRGWFEVIPLHGSLPEPDAVVENCRIVRGSMYMTPSMSDFAFRVTVTN